ncbi:MAG: hypothetical protein IJN48_02025 [Clostridia bacterium]|nr:hypothetical protein [Clostridia bacterium]
MTTPKLSSEKLLDFSLFKNTTRRRLPHILVAFLVNFFTMCVPIMLVYGDYLEKYRGNWYTTKEIIATALRNLNDIAVLNLVFIYMLAAYFGIITLRYMMKRRSAHFYHALPQSRETLYVTSIASSLFSAAVAGAVNLAIASAELAIFGVGYAEVYSAFFAYAFNNTLVFLSTYAIVVFAGSVSGNSIVQILMSIVIMLYPFATHMAMLLMRQTNAYYFWIDYFVNENIIQWLTPFAYVIFNYDSTVSVVTVILAVVATAALLAFGLVIYKKRAIENSENTIVFKKLGSVLKYMFMFTLTIYAGMFFYTIEENIFSLIFGFVSGATLSFMLFNTILEKSPKAMFKNFKGLCIFLAAFAVLTLVLCIDVFKLDEYIPSEKNISYVELDVSEVTFDDNRFDDPEMISALVTLLKNQRDMNAKNVATPFDDYTHTFTINVAFHTKIGHVVARKYHLSKFTDGAEEFLALLADDERMQAAFDLKIAQLSEHLGKNYNAQLSYNFHDYLHAECDFDEFMAVYLSEVPEMNYSTLSKPAVGYVNVRYVMTKVRGQIVYDIYREYDDSDIFNDMPIYDNMTRTISYLKSLKPENDEKYVSRDELSKFPEDCTVINAKVYDTREGVSVARTGIRPAFITRLDVYPSKTIDALTAEKLYSLLYPYNSGRYASITNLFMAIDTDYVVRIDYIDSNIEGATDDMYYEEYYGYEDVKVTVQSNEYQKRFVFPKGMVPDYVKALFK